MSDYGTSYRDDCISFFQRLVQTPSVNSQDTEEEVVKVIKKEAQRLELPYQVLQKVVGRPNIFVGNPQSFGKKDSLLLIAHTDTVPIGDPSCWECPPFSGKIKEDRLYGRGAVDCKGGIALSVYVLKILQDMGKLDLAKFVGVADEESGASSDLGLKFLLEKGLDAQGAVYTYGGGSDLYQSINIGHRGVIRVRATFKGESAHSGSLGWQNGEQGDNAIASVVKFILGMQQLNFVEENTYFPDYRFIATPTLLNGGHGESIVPDQASVLYDIRTLPEQTSDRIFDEIEKIASKAMSKQGFTLDIKTNVPAALSNPNAPFIQKTLSVHEEIFETQPFLKGSGPANESYMLIKKGIPTIAGYGPIGGGFHALNEYADLNSLEKSINFLVRLALYEKC